MATELILPAIEWEPLSLGTANWTFRLPADNKIGPNFHSLELQRDSAWQLRALASGESATGLPVWTTISLKPGQMIPPVLEVTARDTTKFLILREVYLGNTTGNLAGSIEQSTRVSTARICFSSLESAIQASKSCFVWCLNGPDESFPFTADTQRSRVFRYERNRRDFPPRIRELSGRGSALDAVAIPPPVGGCSPACLATVPRGLNLDYGLRPVAVEFFLEAPASAPNWDSLELYLAGLSFVLGRRLIPVGYSLFDDEARQQLHELRSAWAVDLQSDCARQSMPPSPVTGEILGTVVPRFVNAAAQFGLVDAMWLVWLAETVPLEAALPNLASALECIMSAWFKSTKTKSGGKYMPDSDWEGLSLEPMKNLEKALADRTNADRILRRARGANNFGVNERFERFFDELSLQVGEVEIKAISARNKAAHGGSFSSSQLQWLADTVRAYQTLIHKVILRLLEWDKGFIDYSTYGFPHREMNSKLGGPLGDGQSAKY